MHSCVKTLVAILPYVVKSPLPVEFGDIIFHLHVSKVHSFCEHFWSQQPTGCVQLMYGRKKCCMRERVALTPWP